MAAEVVEQPTGVLRVTRLAPAGRELRSPPLETGLEPRDLAKGFLFQQFPQGQEVSVPAPVLEHRQQEPALGSRIDESAPFGRIERERLVDDDRELGLESRQPERNVAAVRRRDHGQIELARPLPDLVSRPDHGHAGVLAERLLAALAVAGHDHGQLQARGRGDERRVEDGAGEPVPEQGDLCGHAWNAASRSASSSSSARAPFGSRPNGWVLTLPFSKRHVPATCPSTRNVFTEWGVRALKTRER